MAACNSPLARRASHSESPKEVREVRPLSPDRISAVAQRSSPGASPPGTSSTLRGQVASEVVRQPWPYSAGFIPQWSPSPSGSAALPAHGALVPDVRWQVRPAAGTAAATPLHGGVHGGLSALGRPVVAGTFSSPPLTASPQVLRHQWQQQQQQHQPHPIWAHADARPRGLWPPPAGSDCAPPGPPPPAPAGQRGRWVWVPDGYDFDPLANRLVRSAAVSQGSSAAVESLRRFNQIPVQVDTFGCGSRAAAEARRCLAGAAAAAAPGVEARERSTSPGDRSFPDASAGAPALGGSRSRSASPPGSCRSIDAGFPEPVKPAAADARGEQATGFAAMPTEVWSADVRFSEASAVPRLPRPALPGSAGGLSNGGGGFLIEGRAPPRPPATAPAASGCCCGAPAGDGSGARAAEAPRPPTSGLLRARMPGDIGAWPSNEWVTQSCHQSLHRSLQRSPQPSDPMGSQPSSDAASFVSARVPSAAAPPPGPPATASSVRAPLFGDVGAWPAADWGSGAPCAAPAEAVAVGCLSSPPAAAAGAPAAGASRLPLYGDVGAWPSADWGSGRCTVPLATPQCAAAPRCAAAAAAVDSPPPSMRPPATAMPPTYGGQGSPRARGGRMPGDVGAWPSDCYRESFRGTANLSVPATATSLAETVQVRQEEMRIPQTHSACLADTVQVVPQDPKCGGRAAPFPYHDPFDGCVFIGAD